MRGYFFNTKFSPLRKSVLKNVLIWIKGNTHRPRLMHFKTPSSSVLYVSPHTGSGLHRGVPLSYFSVSMCVQKSSNFVTFTPWIGTSGLPYFDHFRLSVTSSVCNGRQLMRFKWWCVALNSSLVLWPLVVLQLLFYGIHCSACCDLGSYLNCDWIICFK